MSPARCLAAICHGGSGRRSWGARSSGCDSHRSPSSAGTNASGALLQFEGSAQGGGAGIHHLVGSIEQPAEGEEHMDHPLAVDKLNGHAGTAKLLRVGEAFI